MRNRLWLSVLAVALVAGAAGTTYALAGSSSGPPGVPHHPFNVPSSPTIVSRPPNGPTPACTSSMWAAVESDGTIVRSCGVTGVAHVTDGEYIVYFKKKVDKCAPEVTIGNNADLEPYDGVPGYFSKPDGSMSVGVTSYWQPTDTYYDADFTIVLAC